MADYCTLAELKTYIGTDESGDDDLLNDLITRASSRIDRYCNRTFVARTETREFDAVADVDGPTLFVDDDLLAITTLTNGDGTVLTASDYVLKPSNETPKYGVKLLASSSESWTYQTDPEEAISILGSWGYANTQPEDIRQACIRLSAWYYAQRDAPFETQGFPELGAVTVPTAMPDDTKLILNFYVRDVIGGI